MPGFSAFGRGTNDQHSEHFSECTRFRLSSYLVLGARTLRVPGRVGSRSSASGIPDFVPLIASAEAEDLPSPLRAFAPFPYLLLERQGQSRIQGLAHDERDQSHAGSRELIRNRPCHPGSPLLVRLFEERVCHRVNHVRDVFGSTGQTEIADVHAVLCVDSNDCRECRERVRHDQ